MKSEQEDQARLKAAEEACLVEGARQEAKDHENVQLKVE